MKNIRFIKLHYVFFFIIQFFYLNSQEISEGPFDQLVIRGVTLINGNGSPPIGPVDIEVKKNVITQIKTVGYPGIKKRRNGPILEKNGKELNCDGMYLLPGFIFVNTLLFFDTMNEAINS